MARDCEQAQRQLWLRLDGELDAASSGQLDGHLARCPECRQQETELRGFDALLTESCGQLFDPKALAASTWRRLARRRADAQRQRFAKLGRQLAPFAAAAALLLLTWSQLTPAPPAPAPLPTVATTSSMGLRVQRRGDWRALQSGSELTEGSLLENSGSEPAQLALGGGTTVTLRPQARLKIRRPAPGETEVDLSAGGGEVMCSVTPGQGVFRVQARGLRITVLGTRFLVSSHAELSRVVVLEGRVLCEAGGERAVLLAGQEIELTASGLRVAPADLERRSHWLAKPRSTPQPRPTSVEPKQHPRPARRPHAPKPPSAKDREDAFDLPIAPPRKSPIEPKAPR